RGAVSSPLPDQKAFEAESGKVVERGAALGYPFANHPHVVVGWQSDLILFDDHGSLLFEIRGSVAARLTIATAVRPSGSDSDRDSQQELVLGGIRINALTIAEIHIETRSHCIDD